MTRITQAASHLSLEEVKRKLKKGDHYWCRQLWLIIDTALCDPRAASEIACPVGVSVHTLHKGISCPHQKTAFLWEPVSTGTFLSCKKRKVSFH
jgi:hypothetical protein